MFQTPDDVYDLAIEGEVDAIGVSSLAASHLSQIPALRRKLDVGAGSGIWTRMVCEQGVKTAIAIEPNDDMREIGKKCSKQFNINWF